MRPVLSNEFADSGARWDNKYPTPAATIGGRDEMTKRMLVDATHPEETRVAIVDGNWLTDFDFERTSKKQLKGNIYLAKVIRIEPSLQAAFVEYGGNRHGFLPFSEIHPDYFRIPVGDRPHDEDAPEDEQDDGDNGDMGEVSSDQMDAHKDDAHHEEAHEHLHNEHDHEHAHGHALVQPIHTEASPTEQPVATDGTSVPAQPAVFGNEIVQPLSEFPAEPAQDLGLITDFGNAAVPGAIAADGTVAPEIIPVETVGGEIAEEERPRRAPRPRYKIQEVVKRRQVMLIQVVKEERGNKGAALTTFLSLAGRYCVLMPNTDSGGGVSRKITNHQDRRRLKEILDQLEIPEGMACILRTAGMEQEPAEIQRDLEYLLRLWNGIREQTLQSTAPALIYEEANLIKRSLRDLYSSELSEILVSGQRGYQLATDFMRTILPDQIDKVKQYEDPVALFFRYNVEKQIDQLYSPTVQLRSGGYIVINPTEALVSIDVNSGRSTRERHIEGTALKTNLEAAEEIARQLRLRDLAGLVVIDFIDMEDGRNNSAVERRMKDAMRADRARLQIGRISPFGLLELSRQRLHPSLMEINFEKCPHCAGMGLVRSVDSAAISILRTIEEEGIRQSGVEIVLHVPTNVALYILNQKRLALSEIETRYKMQVLLHSDETMAPSDFRLEKVKANGERETRAAVNADQIFVADPIIAPRVNYETSSDNADESGEGSGQRSENRGGRDRGGRNRGGRDRGGRNRGGRDRNDRNEQNNTPTNNVAPTQALPEGVEPGNAIPVEAVVADNIGNNVEGGAPAPHAEGADGQRIRRRRGRRGGRGRRNNNPPALGPDGQPLPQEARPPREPREPREHHNRDGNRDGNRDRNREPNQNRDYHRPAQAQAPQAPMSYAPPVSVHDLDTTPRVHNTPRTQQAPKTSSPYEVVDTTPGDKPKGGWWRRLTGQ